MFLGGLTRDRDFLKLWSGQAISKIGSTITSVGIPLTAAFVLGASPSADGIPRRIERRRRPRLRPLRRSLGRPPAPPPHPDRHRSRPRHPAGNHSPRRRAAPPEHGAPLRRRDADRHIHRALRRQLPGLCAVPGGPRGTCGSQQQTGAHRVHRRYHRPRPHRSPGATDHRAHGDPPGRPVVPLLRRFRLADS